MKRNITALLSALLLLLSGCQLARQPSQQQTENSALGSARLVGIYVVREDPYSLPDRTLWTEYGTTQAGTQYGQLTFPTEIIVGSYDADTHEFTFPGMEGFPLFVMDVTTEDGSSFLTTISELVDRGTHILETDGGTSYELGGTLYFGPPADDPDYDPSRDDRIWHAYNVFQMEDGTVFLDGTGDSFSGPGGIGFTRTATYTTTVNGEEMEYYTKVELDAEFIERHTSLLVRQYGADGNLLETQDLPLSGELPCVTWLSGAAWAVVEEARGGALTRTAYDRPAGDEPPLSHTVIFLREDGTGYAASLRFE